MGKCEKEELRQIAKLTSLKLNEDEVSFFTDQFKKVLDYVDQLHEVCEEREQVSVRNVNVFREDAVEPTQSEDIIGQAPKTNGRYFSVPKILE